MTILKNNASKGVVAKITTIESFDKTVNRTVTKEIKELVEDDNYIVADDFTVIPKEHCRACKKPLISYKRQYLKRVAVNTYIPYSFTTCYCEQCAIKASSKDECNDILKASVVYRGNRDSIEITEYSDGSVIETRL